MDVDYVEEAGPGIPELPAGAQLAPLAEEPPPLAVEVPKWEQETIEQLLRGTGAGVHWMWGVAERDWMATKTDLDRIAPPLTRILNRYDATLRLAPIADPILAAHGILLWGWRSEIERQRVLRDRAKTETPAARYETAAPGPRPSSSTADADAAPVDDEAAPSAVDDTGQAPYFTEADREAFYSEEQE